jgi:hypothetical protein
MFAKATVSLAVLALIGDAAAVRHSQRKYRVVNNSLIQFMEGDQEDEETVTQQSIAEAEKIHSAKLTIDGDLYQKSTTMNNKLDFKDEEDFNKSTRVNNSMENGNLVQFIEDVHVPISGPIPGVTLVESYSSSDPIHGSLGPKKAKRGDLTAEQQFEYDQRRIPAADLKDEEVTVTHTNESIAAAEAIVGSKMTDPESDKEKKKTKHVKYTLADSDDETEETVETRRSIKTAEKTVGTRFFINARDKKDYLKKVADGKISEDELNFKEDIDQDIGQDAAKLVEKEAAKKSSLVAAAAKKKSEEESKEGKSNKDLKKEEKEQEKADALADAKADTPVNKPAPVESLVSEKEKKKAAVAAPKAAADDFIPPELMGDMGAPAGGAGDFIPPEPMGDMGAPAAGGGDFIPPELMGDMGAVAMAQKFHWGKHHGY